MRPTCIVGFAGDRVDAAAKQCIGDDVQAVAFAGAGLQCGINSGIAAVRQAAARRPYDSTPFYHS